MERPVGKQGQIMVRRHAGEQLVSYPLVKVIVSGAPKGRGVAGHRPVIKPRGKSIDFFKNKTIEYHHKIVILPFI
jgi:hypothetical protein